MVRVGEKPRVVLLFGAGSTLAAGAPSVNEITEHVRTLSQNHALIKAVLDGLEAQCGHGFNFEQVLYALDELTDYLLRKKRPDAWDFVGGVLSAFSRISPPFDEEPMSDPFEIDRYRVAVLASIESVRVGQNRRSFNN